MNELLIRQRKHSLNVELRKYNFCFECTFIVVILINDNELICTTVGCHFLEPSLPGPTTLPVY